MLMLKIFGVSYFFVYFVLAQDISEQNPSETEALQIYNQDWRAVKSLPSTESAWIPQEVSFSTFQEFPKRRRVRKRKRRPIIKNEDSEEQKIRLQRPYQMKELWEEMSDDVTQKSYHRRRQNPIYEDPTTTRIYEKIRDPFTALLEAEEKQKKKIEETTTYNPQPDLKTLLKQTEGSLSLSEILQQKNLTLSELLMGNQQAILALSEKAETTTERLSPSVGLRKEIDRNYERSQESTEKLSSDEVLEAQRKRLALLHGDSILFHQVTKFEVVTEQTTERRIFVPSNSKFYTSVDYDRPEILTDSNIGARITTSSSVKTEKPLPITSAKLNKLTARKPHSKPEPKLPEPVTININEIFGFQSTKINESDGPLKMTIDLDDMEPNTERSQEITTIKLPTTPVGEKLKFVTAKEEMMEILNNPIDRENLSRILKLRNMTFEELVEQRERGSSQRHLADIFHNETREPEPEDQPLIGHINANYFPQTRQQKSRILPSPPAIKKELPTIEIVTSKPEQYTITSFPTFKIESIKNVKEKQQQSSQWKEFDNIYPNIYHPPSTENVNYEDLKRLEDIENHIAEVINDKLNVDINQNLYDEEEFISLPSGVKSAILASLAIFGLSLIVFLTILVIFKWSQKQKRRLNYCGSFSGYKIKSPILETEQKRSFKTFMTETLGRKKKFYKSQNMSDNFWESEKKPYMI